MGLKVQELRNLFAIEQVFRHACRVVVYVGYRCGIPFKNADRD